MLSWASKNGVIRTCSVGELGISVIKGEVSDEEWAAYIEWGHANASQTKGNIALNVDAKVSSAQRKLAAEASEKHGHPKRVALLTDSALVRGTLTAFSWLIQVTKYKAFRPTDLDPALRWLAEELAFDHEEARLAFLALVEESNAATISSSAM